MKKFSIPVVYEMTTYFETFNNSEDDVRDLRAFLDYLEEYAVFEYNRGLTIDVGRPFENEFVFYECQNGHGQREAIDVIQYIAELKLRVNKYLPEHLKY